MKLIKFSIIVFVLMVGPCMGKLEIANSNRGKSTSRLVNELGNILKWCYGDQISGVGLAGNLPSALSRILTVQHLIPVVLINHRMKLNNMPRHLTNDFQYKLPVFIIEGSSMEQLTDIINKMKFSVWWNHMASFFILDLSHGCGNARHLLLTTWWLDMLNAKVMCRSGRGESSIIAYNPFTSQAPVSWPRAEVFPEANNPFTVFSRKYQENETICTDLDFDKTKELRGYIIYVIGIKLKDLKVEPWDDRNEDWQYRIIRQTILRNVHRALNVKAPLRYRGYEAVWSVIKEADIMAHTVRIGNNIHKKMSYPTGIVGRSIVTRFRNREPRRFDESFTVRGIDTPFDRPIVYLITVLLLKFFVDQALVPQLLNLIRVTGTTHFIRRDINSMRVYLTDVGFFVVIMQTIFYAYLTYPLTKQIPLRNVETVRDLVDLSYTRVCGHDEDKYYYKSVGGPEKVFNNLKVRECMKLLNNTRASIACMGDLYYKLDKVDNFNLHLSRELHAVGYESFPMRSNWPLEERFNTMLARLVEANVLEPWYFKFNLTRDRIVRKGEMDRNNKNVESIKLGEITFAFIFLVIGHMCATVVLMIEFVRAYKLRCKIRFLRRYWRLERKKNGCVSLTSTFDSTV